jgi:formate dehydrogenase assembly factor FdhD
VSGDSFTKVHHDGRDDEVAVEEPLEIRVDGAPLVVTMRTPGHDEELALVGLPDRLEQPTFERTGGVHVIGLFDPTGELVLTREDVGRHNAMDKVVGRALSTGSSRSASGSCA